MKVNLSLWVLALLTVLVWAIILQLPDGNVHIVTCDVGQGDAIYIRTPRGADVLVDAGRGAAVLDCLGAFMPFYDRTIEMLVLTHGDMDHIGGVESLLMHYNVDLLIARSPADVLPAGGKPDSAADLGIAGPLAVDTIQPTAGDALNIDGVRFDVLWPPNDTIGSYLAIARPDNENNRSIVMAVQYQSLSALLTGDIDGDVLGVINERSGFENSFFFKTPHHGSRYSLNADVVEILRPAVSTISVGRNSYGHPDSTIIGLLENAGTRIFRTDKNGHIEFVSDGERWSVKTEK